MTEWIDTTCPLTLASLARDNYRWAQDIEPVRSSSLSKLIGKVCVRWEKRDDEIILVFSDSTTMKMCHEQDCCETVEIEDICGDLDDLLDTPLLVADERSQKDPNPKNDDSGTWTFYTFRTIKGTIDVRWYGSSNGYYGEEASISIWEHPANQSKHMQIQVAQKALALRNSGPN